MLSDTSHKYDSLADDAEIEEDDTKLLMRLWLNERLAPALLKPPSHDIVGNILELIENQLELLNSEHNQSHGAQDIAAYIATLAQIEVERLRYVLTSYIRCRLAKIETLVLAVESLSVLLSEYSDFFTVAERAFAERLWTATEASLNKSLSEGSARKFAKKPINMLTGLHQHVICRVLEDIGQIEIDPRTLAVETLSRDDIFLLHYSIVEPLLERNLVELL